MRKRTVFLFLVVLCLYFIIDDVDGRIRGGFRGGGYRSARSYRSYRTTRSSVRSYRSSRSYVRTRSSAFNWKTAAAVGAIYGWSRYSNRRYYSSNRNRRPQICVNYYDYHMDNGTAYTMFVCPQYGQSDSHTYCCGAEGRQKCCTFWDDGGRVTGVVFSILAFVAITASVIYCCCRQQKRRQSAQSQTVVYKKETPHYAAAPSQIPAADLNREFHPGAGMPVQPYNMIGNYPQQGAGDAPYLPPQDTPYPVQPGGPAAYPPQPTSAPYPPGEATPYPPEPGVAPYPPDAAAPYQPGGGYTPYPLNPYPPQPSAPGADTNYPATAPPPYPAQ